MKSGSVAIKGQFTVQKAALEDLSDSRKMLRGASSSDCLSFFFLLFFECIPSLSKGFLVHLKHRGAFALGREVGKPLPQQLVPAGT